ncbi:MAG: Rid family hydrolase [Treponema sp.]|nr:Rid family hydrolase [Treponema sp.]
MIKDRVNYSSGAPLEEKNGYSRIVKVGPFIFAGGTTSVQSDGSVYGEGDSAAQSSYIYQKLIKLMEKAGGCAEDVIAVKRYQTPEYDIAAARSAYSDIFKKIRPLNTAVTIHSLNRPAQLCEIEMTAVIGSADGKKWNGINLTRTNYSSGSPLEDVVGYSRMVKIGPFIFAGGTTSVLPDGTVAGENCAEAQDEFIYSKQLKLIEQAGGAASDIIMMKRYVTPSYHTDRKSSDPFLHDRFPDLNPVCTEVPVLRLTRPAQLEEIEMTAVIGCGGDSVRAEWGNFDFRKELSQPDIVKAGPVLYCAGTTAHRGDGSTMYPDDSVRQESYAMEKVFGKMQQFGVKPDDILKVTAYRSPCYKNHKVTEVNDFYASTLKPVKPLYTAVTTEQLSRDPGVVSQVEMLAII